MRLAGASPAWACGANMNRQIDRFAQLSVCLARPTCALHKSKRIRANVVSVANAPQPYGASFRLIGADTPHV